MDIIPKKLNAFSFRRNVTCNILSEKLGKNFEKLPFPEEKVYFIV